MSTVADPVQVVAPLPPSTTLLGAFLAAKKKPRRFLFVDDDTELCAGFRRESEPWYCEVETASTFGDALRKIRTFSPDVSLLDIRLGGENGCDGLELARIIRKSKPYYPLLFISGWIDTGFLKNVQPLSIFSVKLKPINMVEFVPEVMGHFYVSLKKNGETGK